MKLPFHLLGFVGPLSEKTGEIDTAAEVAMPKRRRRRGRGVATPPDPSPATIDYYCSLKEIAASGAPGEPSLHPLNSSLNFTCL